MRRSLAGPLLATLSGCLCALPGPASAQASAPVRCAAVPPYDVAIAAAAARFALPDRLLRAVIAVESGYAVRAVSPKGAMGLMQIMPHTWADLRARHALGIDPFDPCDNILAGAAYLREMLDRYGDPGFLAAYNAGPGRYEAWRAGRRSLPAETIAYVARISRRLGDPAPSFALRSPPDPEPWRRGELFIVSAISASEPPSGAKTIEPSPLAERARDSLFVARTSMPK